MKIKSKDFRVWEGDEVDLGKWPTRMDPVYQSKENYKKLLGELPAPLPRAPIGGVEEAPRHELRDWGARVPRALWRFDDSAGMTPELMFRHA